MLQPVVPGWPPSSSPTPQPWMLPVSGGGPGCQVTEAYVSTPSWLWVGAHGAAVVQVNGTNIAEPLVRSFCTHFPVWDCSLAPLQGLFMSTHKGGDEREHTGAPVLSRGMPP